MSTLKRGAGWRRISPNRQNRRRGNHEPRQTRLLRHLFSQTGPCSSRVFTSVPSCPELAYSPSLFRVLLLRRLRLPLPFTARSCRRDRLLDPLSNHRAACPGPAPCALAAALSSTLLRGFAARPAHASQPTPLRDLNAPVDCLDDRRIEVIANGLPLWNGAQLAVDTTIVSPLTRDAVPRSRHDLARPVALLDARRQKERTYPCGLV